MFQRKYFFHEEYQKKKKQQGLKYGDSVDQDMSPSNETMGTVLVLMELNAVTYDMLRHPVSVHKPHLNIFSVFQFEWIKII